MASATGSAGTIASGDYMKEQFPGSVICASEALQCPTLLNNGFGAHRIEGIGDKHVPWIHNVKNTDMVVAIDDAAPVAIMRLFNEDAGREYLAAQGVSADLIDLLPDLGISGISNMLSAIKMAKYYEMGPNDVVMTIATDSMEMYKSRVDEYRELEGAFTPLDAAGVYHRYLMGESTDNLLELTYQERKRVHNLKYYTWVEQQGKTYEELMAQWYDPTYWTSIHGLDKQIDKLIEAFNARVGLLN
jgi:cysteine synthase A